MKPFSKLLLSICLLGLVVGLSDVGNPMFSGLARAVGAVFFILFFVTQMIDVLSAEHQGLFRFEKSRGGS